MKALFAMLLVVSTLSITACGQRQVEVSTGATAAERRGHSSHE